MGLGGVVRGLIPVIKGIIGGQDGLMDDLTISYWESDGSDSGDGNYSAPVPFQAVVEKKGTVVNSGSGVEILDQTYIGFIEALPKHDRGDGTDFALIEKDVITLSDGTTGPILSIQGLMDQATSGPYVTEVYLG